MAQVNSCPANDFLVGHVRLREEELLDSRRGVSPDGKVDAALTFARLVVEGRGHVTNSDLTRLREAGYGDAEIAEIVANVAANIFSNYFDHVAQPECDFHKVDALEHAPSTI